MWWLVAHFWREALTQSATWLWLEGQVLIKVAASPVNPSDDGTWKLDLQIPWHGSAWHFAPTLLHISWFQTSYGYLSRLMVICSVYILDIFVCPCRLDMILDAFCGRECPFLPLAGTPWGWILGWWHTHPRHASHLWQILELFERAFPLFFLCWWFCFLWSKVIINLKYVVRIVLPCKCWLSGVDGDWLEIGWSAILFRYIQIIWPWFPCAKTSLDPPPVTVVSVPNGQDYAMSKEQRPKAGASWYFGVSRETCHLINIHIWYVYIKK